VTLFVLGIVAVLAGLGMIGLGIPINEFGFGNMLIGSGVTALVGGFIVIGLAAAVVQLRRIAGLLSARAAPRMGRPGESIEPAASARPSIAPLRAPMPPTASAAAPGRPSPRPAEESLGRAPAVEAPVEVQVERPPPRVSAISRTEAPLAERPEDVTVSPQSAPSRAPYSPISPDLQPLEPKFEPGAAVSANGSGAADTPAASSLGPPWRAVAAAPEPITERNMFASLWESRSQPIAPEHEATAPASDEEPAAPAPVAEPSPPGAVHAEPRPVSILKSGVVDGMAYTLYSDGAIEAELPEGTVRFASIAELREHLERHS
jgi:hypothetical protein